MSDSNIDAFERGMDRHKDILNFEQDNLGRRILDGQAQRIMDRAAREQGSEGQWAPNQGKYGEAKARKGLKVGVGLRPSQSPMLSAENVRGERVITPDEISMEAGATEEARKVAGYFSKDRPWYEMTEGDRKEIGDECRSAVGRNLGA